MAVLSSGLHPYHTRPITSQHDLSEKSQELPWAVDVNGDQIHPPEREVAPDIQATHCDIKADIQKVRKRIDALLVHNEFDTDSEEAEEQEVNSADEVQEEENPLVKQPGVCPSQALPLARTHLPPFCVPQPVRAAKKAATATMHGHQLNLKVSTSELGKLTGLAKFHLHLGMMPHCACCDLTLL